MDIIGIIPARKGSKGVPGKNHMKFLGKPLIEYTIDTALHSKSLNDIWISTDDPEIIKISKKYNKVKLHKRSSMISGDDSPIFETILSVLDFYDKKPDMVMLLQPTSPIRFNKDIDNSIDLFSKKSKYESLISVCEMDDIHPARMYWKSKTALEPILDEYEENHRQHIPKAFFRNGSIYIVRVTSFFKMKSFMIKPILPYIMPNEFLLNIDSKRDTVIAESLIKNWKELENDSL